MSSFFCNRCALHETKGDKFVPGSGFLKAKVVIIGDTPSHYDSRTGLPFSSQSQDGKGDNDLFMKLLAEAGIPPEMTFRTTLVKCRPNMDKYGNLEAVNDVHLNACHPHLDHELSYIKPQIIITMGSAVSQRILGNKSVGQGRVFDSAQSLAFAWSASGEKKTMTRKKAKVEVLLNKPGMFKVLPTYSFAMVRRDPTWLDPIRRTFINAGKLLRGEVLQEESKSIYHYAYTEEEVYTMLGNVWDLTKVEKRMYFDIETSGLNWYKLMFQEHVAKTISCAFGFKEFETFGVVLRERVRSPRILKLYQDILQSKIPKAGHNGGFDNVFTRGEFGFEVKNYDFDTMLAAWQLNQGSKVDLGTQSLIYRPELGRYWEEFENKYLDGVTGYEKAPDDELLPYNCKDVDATATLYKLFTEELPKRGMLECFNVITMPHQAEASQMEYLGTPVDVEGAIALGKKKLHELDLAKAKLFELTGKHPEKLTAAQLVERGIAPEDYRPFNPGSGPQLAKILYEDLKLPVKHWTNDKKDTPSTADEALQEMRGAAPFLDALLDYRGLQKQLSTTIGWERRKDGTEGVITKAGSSALLALVDENGRVHTSIHIHGTATARTSSSDPNLQNIPKVAEFRALIKPRPGWKFGDCDFASLELRILAYYSGDKKLLKAFADGVDMHSATAANMFKLTMSDFEGVDYYPNAKDRTVFEHFDDDKQIKAKYPEVTKDQMFFRKNRPERKAGKAINFGVVYGKGAASLAEELGITKKEAQAYLDNWFETYAEAAAWIYSKWAELEATGCVTYSMGRQRALPAIFSVQKSDREGAKRQCVNTPVQGTGADCTSLAVINVGLRLREELGVDNARLIMEIHDELLTEFRDTPEICKSVERITVEEMERPKPFLRQDLGLVLVAEYSEVADWGASV